MTSNTTGTGNFGASTGASAGAETGRAVKSGLTNLHGIGEAIRGNVNQAVDETFNDKQGVAKNQAISERGINEVETGNYQSHNAGVTPADTNREKAYGGHHTNAGTTGGLTGGTTGGTTGIMAGAGLGTNTSTNAGTGTHNTSTNAGPHSSNLGNKLDPTVDSDLDHRGTTGRTGATGGVTGAGTGSGTTGRTGTTGGVTGAGTGSGTTGGVTGTTGTGPGVGSNSTSGNGPHSSKLMNMLDPRVDSNK